MTQRRNLARIRTEYRLSQLQEGMVNPNPFKQLEQWINEAIGAGCEEPTAMTLATCSGQGKPSARIVLLKGVSEGGCVFFTNYLSRKGIELLENPWAALVLFWPQIERQVRVEGKVHQLNEAASDEYFLSRPQGSKVGAWASPQSQIVPSREHLELLWMEYQERYSDGNVPRPSHWGGYILVPSCFEFWQGRPSRLHDRLQYLPEGEGWTVSRLAP